MTEARDPLIGIFSLPSAKATVRQNSDVVSSPWLLTLSFPFSFQILLPISFSILSLPALSWTQQGGQCDEWSKHVLAYEGQGQKGCGCELSAASHCTFPLNELGAAGGFSVKE